MTNDPMLPTEPMAEAVSEGSGANWKLILLILVGISFFLVISCVGLFAALLFPAVSQARVAAQTVSLSNNMKQVGIAFFNYHEIHQQLPMPSMMLEGNPSQPGASWRVSLVEHLDFFVYPQEWDKAQSWDSEANAAYLEVAPVVYQEVIAAKPEFVNQTCVFVVKHPDGVMSGEGPVKFSDITDAKNQTLLAVSVRNPARSVWTEPRELSLQELQTAFNSASAQSPVIVLYCDGSVEAFKEPLDPARIKAMVTMAGND